MEFELESRLGTGSYKYEYYNQALVNSQFAKYKKESKHHLKSSEIIPLWVADMDVKAPKNIRDFFSAFNQTGIYGYQWQGKNLYHNFIDWIDKRFYLQIKADDLLAFGGVVSSINAIVRCFYRQDFQQKLIYFSPIYPPFIQVAENIGIESKEIAIELSEGEWQIDYDDFFRYLEKDFVLRQNSNKKSRLEKQANINGYILLCHPHNPIGKSWSKEELEPIIKLAVEKDYLIISDEIWMDLGLIDKLHCPLIKMFPEYSEKIISLYAPSKTFNVPSLGASVVYTSNPGLRTKIERFSRDLMPLATFSYYTAMHFAYEQSNQLWLEYLINLLKRNQKIYCSFLKNELPQLRFKKSEFTYLQWLDFSKWTERDDFLNKKDYPSIAEFILKNAKVALSDGSTFAKKQKLAHMARLNFACHPDRLSKALENIAKVFKKII